MKELNIVQLIKNKDFSSLKPVVFVFGNEPLLKKQFADILRKNTKKEVHTFWGDEISIEDLSQVFSSGSLFSEGNLCIVFESDNFLDRITKKELPALKSILDSLLPEKDQVVFISSKEKIPSKEPYKTVKEKASLVLSTRLTPKAFLISVKKKIENSGKKIDDETLKYLTKKLNNDLLYAKQEIEKLLVYTEGKKSVEKEDIDAVVIPRVEENVFSFLTSFFSKDRSSVKMLENLIQTGHHPFEIQSLILTYANKLLIIFEKKSHGVPLEEVFEQTGVKHPAQKGTFKKLISNTEKKEILNLVKELYNLELSQKVYYEDLEKKLENFVLNYVFGNGRERV